MLVFRTISKDFYASLVAGGDPAFGLVQSCLTNVSCCIAQELEGRGKGHPECL